MKKNKYSEIQDVDKCLSQANQPKTLASKWCFLKQTEHRPKAATGRMGHWEGRVARAAEVPLPEL